MTNHSGLSENEAKSRLNKYGLNQLPSKPPTPDILLFLRQLKSPLVYVLLVAAFVTTLLGSFSDTLIISIAVLINTILGYYQERKAERALQSLRNFLHPTSTVIRNGKRQEIPVENLVIGDLVILVSGERVPADGEIIESHSLSVNEAILTGESSAVKKGKEYKGLKNLLVYMGTTIVSGKGIMRIAKTGTSTEMGKIALQLKDAKNEDTPLQNKLSKLARTIAIIVVFIAVLIFVVGVLLGKGTLEMFTIGVAVAVAAIPEGLMVALTVILAIGMQRIFKRKALVRKLYAAETLGSVTLVASDKTGTLTMGKMSVSRTSFKSKVNALYAMHFANIHEDPLEYAMDNYVKDSSIDLDTKLNIKSEKLDELPFDPERKYQAVIVKDSETNKFYVSGAPEIVVSMCDLSAIGKKELLEEINNWGESGLRLVGLAYKNTQDKKITNNSVESLNWAGLVGIEDQVRENVVGTLEQMNRSGIKFIMITGDYLPTAKAVWQKIKSKSELLSRAYKHENYASGEDLKSWGHQDWEKKAKVTTVFARVSPSQKLQIVNQLKMQGEVVAVFGDGVNDSLALQSSDIGVVVNEASDTAKEIADIVLLDSNFNTVISAIEEGRVIYDNIKKVTLYLLSDSFSEIIIVLLALIVNVPLPLTAVQILWINLVTDGFPNLALTVEPKEKNIMSRKPVNPKLGLFDTEMKVLTITISLVTGIVAFLRFYFIWKTTGNLELARTVTFAALGIDSLIYVYSVRSLKESIFSIPFSSNYYLLLAVIAGMALQLSSIYVPFLNKFLNTVPLGLIHWAFILGASIFVIITIELIKWFYRTRK